MQNRVNRHKQRATFEWFQFYIGKLRTKQHFIVFISTSTFAVIQSEVNNHCKLSIILRQTKKKVFFFSFFSFSFTFYIRYVDRSCVCVNRSSCDIVFIEIFHFGFWFLVFGLKFYYRSNFVILVFCVRILSFNWLTSTEIRRVQFCFSVVRSEVVNNNNKKQQHK